MQCASSDSKQKAGGAFVEILVEPDIFQIFAGVRYLPRWNAAYGRSGALANPQLC